MFELSRLVNFGSRRASLSTVGYALFDKDQNTVQARTTTGVVENPAASGIYQVKLSIDQFFVGSIIWDTGEATPLYSAEDIDVRNFTSSSFVIGGPTGKGVWTEEEKERLLKDIKRIIKLVKGISNDDVIEALIALPRPKDVDIKSLQKINESYYDKAMMMIQESDDKKKEVMESVMSALTVLLEGKHIDDVIQEVEKDVKSEVAKLED